MRSIPGPGAQRLPPSLLAPRESVSRGRISRHMRSRFKALISLSSLAPVKRSGSNGPFVLPASSQTKGGFVLPRSPAHCPPEPCSCCQPPHPSPPTSQADRLRFRSGPLSGTSPTFDLLCGSGKSVLSVPEKLPAARGHGPTPAPQLPSPSAQGQKARRSWANSEPVAHLSSQRREGGPALSVRGFSHGSRSREVDKVTPPGPSQASVSVTFALHRVAGTGVLLGCADY